MYEILLGIEIGGADSFVALHALTQRIKTPPSVNTAILLDFPWRPNDRDPAQSFLFERKSKAAGSPAGLHLTRETRTGSTGFACAGATSSFPIFSHFLARHTAAILMGYDVFPSLSIFSSAGPLQTAGPISRWETRHPLAYISSPLSKKKHHHHHHQFLKYFLPFFFL